MEKTATAGKTPLQKEVLMDAELYKTLLSVKNGDFSVRFPVDHTGLPGKFCDTMNAIIEMNELLVHEVALARDIIGKKGRFTQRIELPGAKGAWLTCTDSVNTLISDLVHPTTQIAHVISSVAKGDLSKEMPLSIEGHPLRGEFLRIAKDVNGMVKQLNLFSMEVTRVAKEVGTEGKLGGQAKIKGVAGVWKDLTDSVNQMASNLTAQMRSIANVTIAVARGDLSKKITVDVKGEIAELKDAINTMVDQLNSFASEVTRVAQEVGSEGKLGGQANVKGVAGVWKELTDSVNQMAGNLTGQVRNIAEVTTAVAKGDLSRKITVDVKGEILELKDTINTMVDQLRAFASEVTRVAREVGTDGKLGGQANVPGVAGTWKDLTDSVNQMAGNLTDQVRNIAEVAVAVANGDLSRKITVDVRGEILQLKETINTMVDQLRAFASEVTRVAREVGTDGKLGGQAFVPGVAGTWKDLTDSVNQMTGNLTSQVRNIAEVTKAVASGNLSKTVAIDVKGEILDLKNTINTMVEQLNSFAYEVTRVAREVGTEGKLGEQANVRGVAGTWKDLTDNVNMMASNLTSQVRGIAKVVTSVAKGNLKQKLSIDAKGEVAQLTDTINEMIDTLAVFADQVTTVAREVGAEGKLGGQANVPGASGIWKDLTQNVNQLAANLTTQVRAIADVASAVTKGDLSGTINVQAKGEVEALKDTINQMITNLKATTMRNQEQDWLKSNLAKFTKMLQGQKELHSVSKQILSELARVVSVQHGVFYLLDNTDKEPKLKLLASYAVNEKKYLSLEYKMGESLIGQCALEKERILLTNVPTDYVQISSGLGSAPPLNIMVLPVLFEGQIKAVIELSSFENFSDIHMNFLEQLTESIGIVLNTVESNTRTEELLQQSQKLAGELKSQQEELRLTNEELEEKAKLLAKQKEEVELKNQEVEIAKKSLEEKAAQLTITSQYKSEFLANMSHELRTPLNSLLILSQQLIENKEGNLSEKQVSYSKTIHACGMDLINLINDILDLSKIESGVVTIDTSPMVFHEIIAYLETTFRHMAEYKKLNFNIDFDEKLPEFIETDIHRLKQILKNLLSNAFKFTEKGSINLRIYLAQQVYGQRPDASQNYVAFKITDTGPGISKDKQRIIFEAFQQAEGSTSRKYGGTGLGLSISRGLASLLGGFIDLESELHKGSSFTLYLPLKDSTFGKSSLKISSNGNKNTDDKKNLKISGQPLAETASSEVNVKEKSIVMQDDRNNIKENDSTILIAEQDLTFAKIIKEKVQEKGYKAIVASKVEEVMELSATYKPCAITLDINSSDLNGWKTLSLLKSNLSTRHIPVGVISIEDEKQLSYKRGGRSFLTKPVTDRDLGKMLDDLTKYVKRKQKKLLVIEDNPLDIKQIKEYISFDTVKITIVKNGQEAIQQINKTKFDAIILDLMLPDISGIEVADHIGKKHMPEVPLLIYSAKELSEEEEFELNKVTQAIIPKNIASVEHLLDQVVFHMHISHHSVSEEKRKIIENLNDSHRFLKGKKILIVDDDIRNIFALTTIFEKFDTIIFSAEGGKEALAILDKHKDMDVVLMDIMMPGMDGYETMQIIRKKEEFFRLPIIAVTAKAMRGDREKCIAAGASDYIMKPIDTAELLSLIKLWI